MGTSQLLLVEWKGDCVCVSSGDCAQVSTGVVLKSFIGFPWDQKSCYGRKSDEKCCQIPACLRTFYLRFSF